MQALALQQHGPGLAARQRVASNRGRRAHQHLSRRPLVVRAHEEDEVLPIWSGRLPDAPDPEQLKPLGPLLGGKTLGEELTLMHDAYEQREKDTDKEMHEHLYSANWQGDVYVGSTWNMLTMLMGLSIAVPMAGLVFAWLSYGHLWGLVDYYGA